MDNLKPLTYCEIDLAALRRNVRAIAKLVAKNSFFIATRPVRKKKLEGLKTVLAVVKADAYGHGIITIAKRLDQMGIGHFGVSDISEGILLRRAGIKKPVLLFESTLPLHARKILQYDLIPTVCTLELAKALNTLGARKRKPVDIHIKVDTGMGRLGVWYEDAFDFIRNVSRLRYLRILGIFTHFRDIPVLLR